MKALILAAGLGTRLLPYTQTLPKPLFTLLSRTILEHAIQKLVDHGCSRIIINTHHLHDQINAFVRQKKFNIDIQTIYEPVILDTGGAIANARPYLSDQPFFVMNADIISSVDLTRVYAFHVKSHHLATLVLHDDDRFNKVEINDQGDILSFDSPGRGLAFTGIQVLSPKIFDYFPQDSIFSSITVYQELCAKKRIQAFVAKDIFWSDIGATPDYSRTSLLLLAAAEFGLHQDQIRKITVEPLAGDGSDRQWYRARYEDRSRIVSDHGICLPETESASQMNAFVHIGNHLFSKEIPVPCLFNHDMLSGMVVLEDLGDVHLETLVKEKNTTSFTLKIYKKVIDQVIDFSIKGKQGFKTDWTCQSNTYSKALILEKECRYFVEAFVRGVLKREVLFHDLLDEFESVADGALNHAFMGLMHRDMQSRNIMVKDNRIYFIDFQSARLGPLEYDLASLLIDPYIQLSLEIRDELLAYAMEKLNLNPVSCRHFSDCFGYCCLTRNLQMLGAFGFLSQVKGKKKFEGYIPSAVRTLKHTMAGMDAGKFSKLTALVQSL